MGAEEVLSSYDPGPEPLCFLPVGGGKGGGAGGAEGERVVHKPGLVVQGTSVKIAKWLTLRNFGYLLLTIQQWRVDGEIKGNTSVLKMHIYVTLSLCTKICVIVGSFPEMARTLEMFIFLKLNMLILDITYI